MTKMMDIEKNTPGGINDDVDGQRDTYLSLMACDPYYPTLSSVA